MTSATRAHCNILISIQQFHIFVIKTFICIKKKCLLFSGAHISENVSVCTLTNECFHLVHHVAALKEDKV